MSKIKSALYPVLQRARYAEFISKFEKAKKQPMADNKILMYSTSKGRLGGNLLAIKNYIEKTDLIMTLPLPRERIYRPQISLQALWRKANLYLLMIMSRLFMC